MSFCILLVEDDAAVLSGLRRVLALDGYEVIEAEDGEAALRLAQANTLDLVILDIVLPGLSGLDVCRMLRWTTSVPILILTARDTVPDRVAGLDSGADDYLVKPFSVDELLARVRALLRRFKRQGQEIVSQIHRAPQVFSGTPCSEGAHPIFRRVRPLWDGWWWSALPDASITGFALERGLSLGTYGEYRGGSGRFYHGWIPGKPVLPIHGASRSPSSA